jgi:hypothetical protein
MIVAPILHEVAGRLTGLDPNRWADIPMRWAYAVREAVSMVKPAWVVSHFDLDFESRAIAELASEPDDVWDIDVAIDGPFAPGIELVRTLVNVDHGWTVAASVTGPLRTASALADRWGVPADDLGELHEACGDVIAGLVAAYAEAGASEILVWEPEPPRAPEHAEAAHRAVIRRAALAGAPLSLVAPAPVEGYARTVGSGIVSVPAHAASDPAAWQAALCAAGSDVVVITDSPVPGDSPPQALTALTATAVSTNGS